MIALKEILETIDTLTEIDFYDSKIGDEEAIALAEALKTNTSVTSINLVHIKISAEGVEALAKALEKNASVTELNFYGCKIDNKGAKALAEALKINTNITLISLKNNKIGTEGAKALAEVFKTNTNIATKLDLGNNNIRDVGAKALAEALKTNTNITSIDLWDNHIGYEGAKALAQVLETNTNITKLNLNYNNIGYEGAIALARVLEKNASITELSCSNCMIGNKGAKALAEALKTNANINKLELGFNNIGDEGAKALAEALKTNTNITKLELGFNNINKLLLRSINLLCEENRQIKQSVDDLVTKIHDLDFSDLGLDLGSKARKLLGNTLEKVMLPHLVKLSQEKIITFNERCGFKDDSSLVHYKEQLIKLTGNAKLIKGIFDQYTKITESCINLMVTFCAHSDIEIGLEENVNNNNQSSSIETKIRFFNQIRELLKNCTLDEIDAYCFGQFVTEDSGSSAAKIKIEKSEYKKLEPFLDYLPSLKKVFSGSNIEIIEDSSLFIDNDMISNNTLKDIKEGKQEIDNEPELVKSLLEHIPTVVEVAEASYNAVPSLGEEPHESTNE